MKRVLALVLVLAALVAVGCGDDDDDGGSSGSGEGGQQQRLIVSAAASMTEALEACAPDFGEAEETEAASLSPLGRAGGPDPPGVKPDVFAAANTKLPDELYSRGVTWSSSPSSSPQRVRPRGACRLDIGSRPTSRTRDKDRHRLRVRADRLLYARGAGEAPPHRRRRFSTTSGRTSLTSRGSSARCRRARSMPASSTSRMSTNRRRSDGDQAPAARSPRSLTRPRWSRGRRTRRTARRSWTA